MPRAIWSGAISFGLVTVPVKLYSAVSKKNIKFNQLDSNTNSRVSLKRFNSENQEVPYENIVKGYEIEKDSYVIITDEDLKNVAPRESRMIDIISFVQSAQIDPVFYDSAYYLVPEDLGRKAYALLLEAMESSAKVAIAKIVMRNKEHLVALRSNENILTMSTMVYEDEVVSPVELPGYETPDISEISQAELNMASELIDSLSTNFDAKDYEDSYREKLLNLIEDKSKGEVQQVSTPEEEDAEVVDLIKALRQSVNQAKGSEDSKSKSA